LFVLHKCDVPACVNPDHLFLGTNKDNMEDKVAKGRQAKGSRNGMARMCEADVASLRELVRGGMPIKFAARAMDISEGAAHDVLKGRSWKHVP
jgi:hypothetical protein